MLKPNRIILKLIASNFFLNAGWGFIAPIFAIYITEQIKGGSLQTVGLAVAFFWMVKSVIQPFMAHKMDRVSGEDDDFSFLLKGMIIITIVPLFYIFSTAIWHIFILEAVRGIGMALVVPSWTGIFTRHIDKYWEAYTWSLQSTALGFAAAFAAAFGGMVAAFVGFKAIFVIVFLFGVLSTVALFFIKKEEKINGDENL